MLGIFLIIYLAYRNGLIAKLKGKNTIQWVVLTVVSYLFFYVLGALTVLIILIESGQINVNNIPQTDVGTHELTNQIIQIAANNPIHWITMEAFGIGGYLLIRFILERMPTVNTPKDNEGVV